MIIDINAEIITLLEKNLIKPEIGLDDIYNRIKKYYTRSCEIKNKPSDRDLIDLNNILSKDLLNTSELQDSYSYLKEEKLRSIAIDFPIEIRKGSSNRKKIMVVAMDSLPPNKGTYTKSIISWSPFSLIYNWDLANKSSKQNIIFFKALLEEVDIYITDLYKIFFRTGNEGTDNRSNKNKKYTEINVHKSILGEEIKIINPNIILTLGNDSRDVMYKLIKRDLLPIPLKWNECKGIQPIQYWLDKKTRIISIPHISGAANGAKKHLLNNNYYKTITDKDSNVKIANIILSIIKQGEAENL